MDQSEDQAKLLAAMIVVLSYESGDLPADYYPALERARAVIAGFVPKAEELLRAV